VATLVLDEADRLLDLGFAEELARILALLPAGRQNLFFSATFAPAVQALAGQLLREPVRIAIAAEPADRPDITQRAIVVDAPRRTQLLRHLLAVHGWERALVFVATKYAAEQVADKLRRAGLSAEPFHGLLSQGKRNQVLADFKAQRVQVVVSTDLAGRGIDIAMLPVVVNFDLPRSPIDHVHRIGRTGRAGESGLAVSFVRPCRCWPSTSSAPWWTGTAASAARGAGAAPRRGWRCLCPRLARRLQARHGARDVGRAGLDADRRPAPHDPGRHPAALRPGASGRGPAPRT
jgi:superfamily II DNA/RNA helicase